MAGAPRGETRFLDWILLGVGLLYGLIIPPTFTSFLSGAYQSINFSSAYDIFMYPIGVVEHSYHTFSYYPFVLALLLAWTSLPESVFLGVLLRRRAKRSARSLLVFYAINLAAGTLLLVYSIARSGT